MILKVIIAILGLSVKGVQRVDLEEDYQVDLEGKEVDLEDKEEDLEDPVEGQEDQDDQVLADQEVMEDEVVEVVEVEAKVKPNLLT